MYILCCFKPQNSSFSSVSLCVYTMYSLLYGLSQGTEKHCLVFLPDVLPSTAYSAVLYLSMMREQPGEWAPPHCIVALQSISISLWSGCCWGWPTAFLIWWWAVKWPACPHDRAAGARVEFQGFPYQAASWVGRTILYTHTPILSQTPTHLLLLLLGPMGRPRL